MNERSESFSELSAAFIPEPSPEPEPEPEAAAEPEPEPAPADATEAADAPRRGWRGFVVPIAVLLLVASNITFALLLFRGGADRHQAAVSDVAERFVENLITFNFRTLDADIARIQQDATGTFQTQFDSALGGDVAVFRDAIREAQAESAGSVRGVMVMSIRDETARVLVVADQAIRNRETPDPRSVLRVVEVTLVNTAEGWKVNDVSTLGGEGL